MQDNTPAHQAMLRQVELSVGRPPDPSWKRPPGRPRTKWTDHSAMTTTTFPLRLCGSKPLVAVTREQRYGPSWLRVNEDDHKTASLSAECSWDKSPESTSPQGHRSVAAVSISLYRHYNSPVPSKNRLAKTSVVVEDWNLVAKLWSHPPGIRWPPKMTSSFLSADFWYPNVPALATEVSWMGDRIYSPISHRTYKPTPSQKLSVYTSIYGTWWVDANVVLTSCYWQIYDSYMYILWHFYCAAWHGNIFVAAVCMQHHNFWNPWLRNFIFGTHVHLQKQ